MADVTVAQFADVLKVPVDRLLTQLDEAGIKVSGADATISDEAKMELLTHLRRAHGRDEAGAPRKITLKRKSQGEIKVATSQGRARTVNVEAPAGPSGTPVIAPAPLNESPAGRVPDAIDHE